MRLLLSPMVDISWGTIPKVDRWLPHTDTQMNICSSSPLLWCFGPESWTWVQLTAGENMKHHHDGNTMLSRSWSTCLKSENKHWFKESQLIWLRRPRAPQQSSQMTPCWGHWSVYLLWKHFCISVLFGGLCFNVNSIIIRLYFFLTYVFLTSMITCLLVNGSADQNKCKMFVCFLLLFFKSTTKKCTHDNQNKGLLHSLSSQCCWEQFSFPFENIQLWPIRVAKIFTGTICL